MSNQETKWSRLPPGRRSILQWEEVERSEFAKCISFHGSCYYSTFTECCLLSSISKECIVEVSIQPLTSLEVKHKKRQALGWKRANCLTNG